MEISNEYTLITGATGGLGSAFCHACAKRGEHLFLTARSQEKLDLLCQQLQSEYPNVQIKTFAANLANEQGRDALKEKRRGIGCVQSIC